MKVANLYIRVSTDEQADKGYSQRNQDETLQWYCQLQGITVGQIIYEDHSAKTFNRPAWQSMLSAFKKKSAAKPSYILFTKWDRFSRNAADAYQMINFLRTHGVEPQAIEQPLDLTIPENKMMLAFYLAAPEVENDRRALNVFHGMRRAKKEGRWMATAPIGYKNKSHENGHKYIAIDEPIAEIVRWAFEEIARGKNSIDQVWKNARQKGLCCTRSNFASLIRNPVYCSKLIIPEYKDEPMQIVQAQHQSIVSETLFEDVQRVLDSRKRLKNKISMPSKIVLRGFLKCPKCNRMLTGSQSKGCRSHYSYYHCSSTCGIRFNADLINDALAAELKKYCVNKKVIYLFKKIFDDAKKEKNVVIRNKIKKITTQLAHQRHCFQRAKDLLLLGDLDATDYREIKKDTEIQISTLTQMLSELSPPLEVVDRFYSDQEIIMFNLSFIYLTADISQKRKLIGYLFPKNLTYYSNSFHDMQIDNVLKLIYVFAPE